MKKKSQSANQPIEVEVGIDFLWLKSNVIFIIFYSILYNRQNLSDLIQGLCDISFEPIYPINISR